MTTSKAVLIIGGSGFIGYHLARRLRQDYKVYTTYNRHFVKIDGVTQLPLNIENRIWGKRLIYLIQPEVVIYCVGNHRVEFQESQFHLAEALHSTGPSMVASCLDILQPRFIYLSAAQVFDGMRGNYHESDPVIPHSSLGRVKAGGENIVRSKCLNYMILRVSPLLGRSVLDNPSFLDALRMALSAKRTVKLSHYELHSYANLTPFLEVVHRIIDSGMKNRVLHYGGLTRVSAFDLGQAFARTFGFDPELVVAEEHPYLMTNRSSAQAQVLDYSLNSTQLSSLLKIEPLVLEESLDLLKQEMMTRA